MVDDKMVSLFKQRIKESKGRERRRPGPSLEETLLFGDSVISDASALDPLGQGGGLAGIRFFSDDDNHNIPLPELPESALEILREHSGESDANLYETARNIGIDDIVKDAEPSRLSVFSSVVKDYAVAGVKNFGTGLGYAGFYTFGHLLPADFTKGWISEKDREKNKTLGYSLIAEASLFVASGTYLTVTKHNPDYVLIIVGALFPLFRVINHDVFSLRHSYFGAFYLEVPYRLGKGVCRSVYKFFKKGVDAFSGRMESKRAELYEQRVIERIHDKGIGGSSD